MGSQRELSADAQGSSALRERAAQLAPAADAAPFVVASQVRYHIVSRAAPLRRGSVGRPQMRVSIFAALLPLLVAYGYAQDDPREPEITAAVLRKYLEQTQGGTAIAFPEERRPVRLANRTIIPSAAQLKVSMFSRENDEVAAEYELLRGTLTADLVSRSRRAVVLKVNVPNFRLARTRRGSCGPHASETKYSDAVAVSRPGVSRGADAALVYLEYDGGGCAYYVKRVRGKWTVLWRVELWACG